MLLFKKKKIRCSLPDKVTIHSAYDSTSKAAKVLDYTKFKEVIAFDDGMADYITRDQANAHRACGTVKTEAGQFYFITNPMTRETHMFMCLGKNTHLRCVYSAKFI